MTELRLWEWGDGTHISEVELVRFQVWVDVVGIPDEAEIKAKIQLSAWMIQNWKGRADWGVYETSDFR